jgi:hypothetical protein
MTELCRNDRIRGDPPPHESQGGEWGIRNTIIYLFTIPAVTSVSSSSAYYFSALPVISGQAPSSLVFQDDLHHCSLSFSKVNHIHNMNPHDDLRKKQSIPSHRLWL